MNEGGMGSRMQTLPELFMSYQGYFWVLISCFD